MYKILKNNLCPYWIKNLWLVLFIIYVTTFNYGGCGGGGGVISGSSGSITLSTPLVTTKSATDITQISVTLNGTVNPNGAGISVYFQFGTSIAYGSATTSQDIGSGTTPVTVTATITGLSPNITYNFRIIATIGSGTGIIYNGTNQTFTTTGLPPICATNVANNISSNSARLSGTVNPNGVDTTAYFNYGLTTSYDNTTTSQNIGNGTSNIQVNADISGLSSSIQYNFRVVGTSSAGTTYGNNLTFITGAPVGSAPTCTTDAASNITINSAKLNGTVNPNGIATNAYFNYGLTTSYTVTTISQPIGSGTLSVAVSATAGSLTINSVYNFRVVGVNATGTTYGNNLTFTTLSLPSSTTNAATNVTYNSAKLNGTVNPNGFNTTAYFQWGTTTSYGNTSTLQTISSGTTSLAVNADISGLSASTQYNFRCVATNAGGTTNGLNQTFTTAALPPPTCTTDAASDITTNSARLNGTVNPNGLDTTAYFQWGQTTSYGSSTTSQDIGSGTSNVNVTADISGLSANITYNFRIIGTNSSGTTYGNNLTFTTGNLPGSAPTCTTDPANNITYNSTRLNGTVNPNGTATNAYFQYSTPVLSTPVLPIGSGTTSLAVSATVGSLTPNTLYNFRVVATNSTGTNYGTNQTFTTIVAAPAQVDSPTPTNGATNVITTTQLSWAPALRATSYNVYFGTTSPGTFMGNQSSTTYNPGTLTYNTTYYWRVDAKNSAGATTGQVYSFTTRVWGVLSTLDSTGDVGLWTSIALDSNNKVHISYHDNTNDNLKYATNASGSWVCSTIDSVGAGAWNISSIALDSNNKVHISYYDGTNLKYATNASGSWVYTTLDSACGVCGGFTSIALDSTNKVHISYFDYTNSDLKYATNATGSWVCSTLDSTGDVGWYTAIAIASNNKVHISYYDRTNSNLKYATNASGSWVCSTLDSMGDSGSDTSNTSIAIDSNFKVHISYYNYTNSDLKYATNATGSWVCSTLDSTGDVGWNPSIAIDSNNKVHISYGYSDVPNANLKYATNASGSWVCSTLDSTGDVGWCTSIAIDSTNKVHISYWDWTNDNLKYATNK